MKRFSDFLLDQGHLDADGLAEARRYQANVGGPLGEAAVRVGLARESDMLAAQSEYLGLAILPRGAPNFPQTTNVRAGAEHLKLDTDWLVRQRALIWFSDDQLQVALNDPFDAALEEEIGRRWAGAVRMHLIAARDLEAVLSDLAIEATETADSEIDSQELARLRELAEEAPVIAFVNGLFGEALEHNASDVHIEPSEDGFTTRLRVDGVLGHAREHPRSLFDSAVTRVKILSGMDIAERRLPQDGRQTIRVAGEDVDLRVSSLPATEGESIVVRLLRKKSDLPDMEGLGLRGDTLAAFRRLIELPNGVFLVTGPTGSGKSTTLYRALEHLNTGETKLLTIEDPVEYDIDGINQVQARSDIGLTFAAGLRSMLRQDPDVIMVGEIRDRETAEVAIQAALTGHLVFSTLHTNSARGAIERLIDLGVEPFLIGASLRGVLGQRLLRRLCKACRRPSTTQALQDLAGALVPAEAQGGDTLGHAFYEPQGCESCGGTGYKGRIGVYELLDVAGMREKGLTGPVTELAQAKALQAMGFRSMLQDAVIKASHGETALAEIDRVFGRLERVA